MYKQRWVGSENDYKIGSEIVPEIACSWKAEWMSGWMGWCVGGWVDGEEVKAVLGLLTAIKNYKIWFNVPL